MGANDDHITRLESEIRYLKGLLDENGIPYDYEAFVDVAKREEPVEIEFPVLTAEHAILSRTQGCVCEAKCEEGLFYAMQQFLENRRVPQEESRKGEVPGLSGKGL